MAAGGAAVCPASFATDRPLPIVSRRRRYPLVGGCRADCMCVPPQRPSIVKAPRKTSPLLGADLRRPAQITSQPALIHDRVHISLLSAI